MKIRTIANQAHLFLCLPQGGKPDPRSACTTEVLEKDTRPRIDQVSLKANLCLDYSLLVIADRIGKNPSADLTEKRKIEMLCSERRKEIIRFERKMNNANQLVSMLPSSKVDSTAAKRLVDQFSFLSAFSGDPMPIDLSVLPLIEEFSQQTKHANFKDFTEEKRYQHRDQVNKNFLDETGLNPQELFESYCKFDINAAVKFENKEWKDLSKEKKSAFREKCCTHYIIKSLGLKKSDWTPFKTIDTLISELKSKGPMVVGGSFGAHYYSNPVTKKGRIGKYPIYGWEPGSRKKENLTKHAIVLVGAEKNHDQQIVYYIDVNDTSMVDSTQLRKIYAISYKTLKNNVGNLFSIHGKDVLPSPAGYGFCARNVETVRDKLTSSIGS